MAPKFISEEHIHSMRAFLFSVAKAFKRATKRVTSQSSLFEEVAEEVLVQEKSVTSVATEKGMMQPAVSKAALEMDDALDDFCKETGLVRAEVVLTPKALKTVLELEEEKLQHDGQVHLMTSVKQYGRTPPAQSRLGKTPSGHQSQEKMVLTKIRSLS